MQSSPGPAKDSSHATPFSTPLPPADENPVFPSANASIAELDPLIARTAEKLTELINIFKRQLDDRDGYSANTQGSIEIVINSTIPQTYILSLIHDSEGKEHPISVNITQGKGYLSTNGHPRLDRGLANSHTSTDGGVLPTYRPAHHETDSVLEQDIISRRKRKISVDGDRNNSVSLARKRIRTNEGDDGDAVPLITKHELEELFAKQREDIHEDTTECVNHVQRLLRRWREQWRDKSDWELNKLNQLAAHEESATSRMPCTEVSTNRLQEMPESAAGVLATPEHARLKNLPEIIRKEAEQLSKQIRWVEECRRIASDAHDKREDTWRASSAAFHGKNRQDRVSFEKQALNSSAIQGNMLSQILTEVKTLASVVFSLKWETPPQFSPLYPPPLSAPFPGQDQSQAQKGGQAQNLSDRPS
ncbi:hypothetical protein AOQ84DRAFT_195538 [Glonium stellatum]|uniref:Uncharacterized protein n=1 Tax=Glonium stellatum TaxID=574774 RepID=A0A8E2JZH1_9PEZI|nr:hypothetical protein AOQ84DRAFT_195538 [Glonium stellatum]